MDRTQKQEQIELIGDRFSRSAAAVLTDFRGLDVESMNALRAQFRAEGIEYKVVKNTLIQKAVKDEAFAESLDPHLVEPTAVAWAYDDPVAPARVAVNFAKDNEDLRVKCAVLDGDVLDPEAVKRLSKMPGRDEIRAKLLATFMAPAQGMVRLLAAAPTNFMYLLDARKRELGGE